MCCHKQDNSPEKQSSGRARHIMMTARRFYLGLAVVAIAIGGVFLLKWSEDLVDQNLRQSIRNQAELIARALDSEKIPALTFTESDLSNPAYQTLSAHMREYCRAIVPFLESASNNTAIYSIARRDSLLYFGPESIPRGDRRSSPPGTVYEQPPIELENLFKTKHSVVVGPYVDEYGKWVSAFAPVIDEQTGEVMLVIGLDREADHWQASLHAAMIPPSILVGLLLLVVLGGASLLRHIRLQASYLPRWATRSGEMIVTGCLGIMLTVIGVYVARGIEDRSRLLVFNSMANADAHFITEEARSLQRESLAGLATFLGHTENRNDLCFSDYTLHLLNKS